MSFLDDQLVDETEPVRLTAGLDLGQSQDPSAFSIVERYQEVPEWHMPQRPVPPCWYLRHLERPPLNTPYPHIIGRAINVMGQLDEGSELVVDATGVGRPVVDDLVAAGLNVVAITITGGLGKPSREIWTVNGNRCEHWRVCKRDIVIATQVAFQKGIFKIVPGDPDNPEERKFIELCELFRRELLNFRIKQDIDTGRDSFEAERQGDHDDIVLSVAIALWRAMRERKAVSCGYLNLAKR